MIKLLFWAGMGWLAWQVLAPALRAQPRRDLDRDRARSLLGVGPQATRDDILAAHRRLVARVHPDAGGTEALAAELNAARDLLLSDISR